MLEIKTTAFKPSEFIPKKHTGEGADLSPELSWSGAPKETRSFALIMEDPDAPPGLWIHWLLYDVPQDVHKLSEGLPKTESLANGGKQGLCWGVDKFERVGYFGPYPPPGSPHRYFFKLYALDKVLGLAPKAAKKQLEAAMAGHILAQAEAVGIYKR
ncbi:MAG: phosphatidylethanolamine-binding protein [Elusimicrobia bacterium RIFCSPHIGHO2_02_FULL_57_9]|nr:MAG: phosphatidylethanolamine-binding protein [Elusimicrobia bacterium RIFCSPHIGHO2_02_FULL_57_9]